MPQPSLVLTFQYTGLGFGNSYSCPSPAAASPCSSGVPGLCPAPHLSLGQRTGTGSTIPNSIQVTPVPAPKADSHTPGPGVNLESAPCPAALSCAPGLWTELPGVPFPRKTSPGKVPFSSLGTSHPFSCGHFWIHPPPLCTEPDKTPWELEKFASHCVYWILDDENK